MGSGGAIPLQVRQDPDWQEGAHLPPRPHAENEPEALEPCELCTPARICTHLLEKSHIGQAALGFREQGRKRINLEAVLIRTGRKHR